MAARRPTRNSPTPRKTTPVSFAEPANAVEPASAVKSGDAAVPADPAGFAELGVPAALVRILAGQDITSPRPIQAATLPDSLAGRDVLGRGRTGSGKTYAFLLPMLVRLAASGSARRTGRPRALILVPTRELATQIEVAVAPLAAALSLRTLTVFGGVAHGPQLRGLRAGVDIVVACPGRLSEHVDNGAAKLDAIEITVLDEADHMANLGFLPTVRRLLDRTPREGQRLLFSATLDAGVDVLVRRFLTNPVTHSVDSERSPVSTMAHHVLHIDGEDRLPVLVELAGSPDRTLVFTRTKHRAKQLARRLVAAGVPAVEMHGNLAQNARQRNLAAFADGSATTLVATDIAARGIHVDDIALVVHADPPIEHKAYLHRSGRTARGDASGTVVTLMTDDQVDDVRKLVRQAGINPTTTRVAAGGPLPSRLVPAGSTDRPRAARPAVGPAGPAGPAARAATPPAEGRTGDQPGGPRSARAEPTNSRHRPSRRGSRGGRPSGRPAAAPRHQAAS
ncbi:MAG TPA: DEAD/DEAH box helicase [Pseudonocardia sp.]|jgi:superfamily II DNA/RNA helicase|uniref:DEAD/DEAH box helicase n=1 Tax=Pseudonocardia sp. TaxID=60912 RepID=UPI002F41F207